MRVIRRSLMVGVLMTLTLATAASATELQDRNGNLVAVNSTVQVTGYVNLTSGGLQNRCQATLDAVVTDNGGLSGSPTVDVQSTSTFAPCNNATAVGQNFPWTLSMAGSGAPNLQLATVDVVVGGALNYVGTLDADDASTTQFDWSNTCAGPNNANTTITLVAVHRLLRTGSADAFIDSVDSVGGADVLCANQEWYLV